MKTLKFKSIIFIIVVFCFPSFLNSQVIYTKRYKPPQVAIELLFSYPQPLPGLFGDIGKFFTFSSYGVKSGIIGGQINVKLVTDKKGRIRPYLTTGYSLFQGKDNGSAYVDTNAGTNNGYPLSGNSVFIPVSGSSKMYMHIFNAGLGFEYSFINKTRWIPHLEAELDMNIIYGKIKQSPNVKIGSYDQSEFTIKQATRFGFGFGGGVEVRLSQAFGLAFTAKYKFTNVLGKESEKIFEQNKMKLLDKAAAGLNGNLSKDRQIMYIEALLGAVFYIGKK